MLSFVLFAFGDRLLADLQPQTKTKESLNGIVVEFEFDPIALVLSADLVLHFFFMLMVVHRWP